MMKEFNQHCNEYPVRKNVYGNMTDKNNRVGTQVDQYETLQSFVDDVVGS